MTSRRRYRCRYCGVHPARLAPVGQGPERRNPALPPRPQHHPDQVGPYLERMATEYIATVAAEAYEVVED